MPPFSGIRAVENGVVTQTWSAGAGGAQTVSRLINPVGGNVVRFEGVTSGGNPVAYTNPLYFVDAFPTDIPEDRRVFGPDWLHDHHGGAG